jgi:proteasome assembly chaperone (PAC2) family protein
VSTPVRIQSQDPLREPTLALAYAGWNDGGEAATYALRFALETLSAEPLASIEMEEFLDFTVVRPHVHMDASGTRSVKWPDHEFFCVRSQGQPFDLVIGLGVEPHLRWRSYIEAVQELIEALGVRRVVLLGAYLDEVIYSQPVRVIGSATETGLHEELRLDSPEYEGPTGMLGVLGHSLAQVGVDIINLWAALPHYVQRTPNSRASLAILQRFESLLGYRLDLTELVASAGEFDREVSEMIAGDPQLAAYVRELKRRAFST